MAVIRFGAKVPDIEVLLPWDASFFQPFSYTGTHDDGSPVGFGDGDAVEFHFHTAPETTPLITYQATLTGPNAGYFHLTKAQVQAVLAAAAKVVRFQYIPAGQEPIAWGGGRTVKE